MIRLVLLCLTQSTAQILAVVYDTAESSAPTIQLLEYAHSQLLEFRHYDHVLTLLLSEVYDVVSRALVATSRDDGRYKELAERLQRKGPAKEQATERPEKRNRG